MDIPQFALTNTTSVDAVLNGLWGYGDEYGAYSERLHANGYRTVADVRTAGGASKVGAG